MASLKFAVFCICLFFFSSSYNNVGADRTRRRGCPIDFKHQNYTILTSNCKPPDYPAKPCCDAFKKFACPFAEELNDLRNDCASVMFSYINLHGKYPPGLFASECREGSGGLTCSAPAPAPAPYSP